MTAVIVTQEGVEVAYNAPSAVVATQEGVEVAYEEQGPGPETFEVMFLD